MNGNEAGEDASMFASVSEDNLVQMGIGLFQFFLHDDHASKFRKMLTVPYIKEYGIAVQAMSWGQVSDKKKPA